MNSKLIALGIASLIGVGAFTVNASASDSGLEVKEEAVYQDVNGENGNYRMRNKNGLCNNLSDEQKKLLEQGYNELNEDEKKALELYRGKDKRRLSEEELQEFYQIQDKLYKYMDEDFKVKVKERREFRKNNKGQGRGCGQGKGRGQGNCGQ